MTDECGKDFTSKFGLQYHTKSAHWRIKDYACRECDYTTSLISSLNRHTKLIHSDGSKNIKCPKCLNTFALSHSLKVHLKRAHEKLKDMVCLLCDFSTYTRGELNMHVRKKHLTAIKNVFQCEECSYNTEQKTTLERHKKCVHKKEKDLICMECNKAFALRQELVGRVRKGISTKHINSLATFVKGTYPQPRVSQII